MARAGLSRRRHEPLGVSTIPVVSPTEDRRIRLVSRDLKEERYHVVPESPGRRNSTRLGTRTDHPQARMPRTAGAAGRECQLDLARPGEFFAGHRARPSPTGAKRSRSRAGSRTRVAAPRQRPFEITIYASPIRGINRYSVPIGDVQIPAGLAAGEAVPYQTSVVIPSTPVPDVSSSGGTLYIDAVVNPATHGRRKQLP